MRKETPTVTDSYSPSCAVGRRERPVFQSLCNRLSTTLQPSLASMDHLFQDLCRSTCKYIHFPNRYIHSRFPIHHKCALTGVVYCLIVSPLAT